MIKKKITGAENLEIEGLVWRMLDHYDTPSWGVSSCAPPSPAWLTFPPLGITQ